MASRRWRGEFFHVDGVCSMAWWRSDLSSSRPRAGAASATQLTRLLSMASSLSQRHQHAIAAPQDEAKTRRRGNTETARSSLSVYPSSAPTYRRWPNWVLLPRRSPRRTSRRASGRLFEAAICPRESVWRCRIEHSGLFAYDKYKPHKRRCRAPTVVPRTQGCLVTLDAPRPGRRT